MAQKEKQSKYDETFGGYQVRNVKTSDVLVTAEIYLNGQWVKHSFSPDGSHKNPNFSITLPFKP